MPAAAAGWREKAVAGRMRGDGRPLVGKVRRVRVSVVGGRPGAGAGWEAMAVRVLVRAVEVVVGVVVGPIVEGGGGGMDGVGGEWEKAEMAGVEGVGVPTIVTIPGSGDAVFGGR